MNAVLCWAMTLPVLLFAAFATKTSEDYSRVIIISWFVATPTLLVVWRIALRAILPKSKLAKAIRYAVNQWSKLEVYLGDGRIEIDTNLVENAIRPTKLGAKNWLFIGCREAGQRAAILYTIIENCRRLKIDTREYLEEVLTRLPGMKESEVAALIPANWLRARQGKPVRKAA